MKKTEFLSGWCEGPLHDKCPKEGRAERITPKGTLLRTLVCSCKCHVDDDGK